MTIVTRSLMFLVVALWSGAACADVEMKILTPKGFVAFTAEDSWPVLSTQSKMPVAAVVFQIPNAADEGTPDSTNLIVMFYQLESDVGHEKFEEPLKQYGAIAPTEESFGEWTIYRQDAKQGDTLYSIVDAKRSIVADVSVSVRLAWPHLDANAKNYVVKMDSLFRAFLRSNHGGLGPFVPGEGEIILRPEQ